MHKVIQRSLSVLIPVLILSGAPQAQAATQAKQSATLDARQQKLAETFKEFDTANWIAEGKGARVLYIFFDPNCPYCHKLYEELRTRVGKNDLELRWIPVGILMTTSFGKAAAILEAKDPLAAFRQNEEKFSAGGAAQETFAGAATEKRLNQNSKLLTQIGGQSVPTLVYRDATGHIKVALGGPVPNKLDAFLAQVK
jgi:thiol:disulfide interchange protein DsbG